MSKESENKQQEIKYIDSEDEEMIRRKPDDEIIFMENKTIVSGEDNKTIKSEIKFHKERKSQQTNLDYVLALVGSFGFYQKLQFLLVGCLSIVPSMLAYSYVFVAATPKFTCKSIVERHTINYDLAMTNFTQTQMFLSETSRYINLIADVKNVTNFDSRCEFGDEDNHTHYYSNDDKTFDSYKKPLIQMKRSFKCLEWLYDPSLYGPTISNEWDLVCVRSHLKAATQNAYIIGTAGAILSGIMSDRLGRKKTLFILIALTIVVLNATQLLMQNSRLNNTQKLVIFTISRLFQGFGQTMYSVSFVLLMEITGPNTRVLAGNVMAYSFAIGQMVIAGLSYYLRDWNKIMWSIAFYVIPFFGLYWLVPESPRWLLNQDKVGEAKIVIKKISKINNAYSYHMMSLYRRFGRKKDAETLKFHSQNYLKNEETSEYIVSLLQEEASKFRINKKSVFTYSKTLKDIKNSKKLLKTCFILFYNWMVILMVYLGMGMAISSVMDQHVNPYLMFLIQAGFEFLGIVTCHIALSHFNRKIPLVFFMALSSVAIFFIPFFFTKYPMVSGAFYLVAKYSISAAQLTCMIFTSETYPTPMRGTGVGLSVCLARFGGVWAPQINVLSRFGFHVPYMIFSALALIAAFSALFLPRNMNKKLPDSAKEAEKMDRNSSLNSKKTTQK